MRSVLFSSSRDLLPAAPFLMFKMAVADGPNDDRAKAPTILASSVGGDRREQTGGPLAVRPGWLWGVATGARRGAPSPHITRLSPLEHCGKRILRIEIQRFPVGRAALFRERIGNRSGVATERTLSEVDPSVLEGYEAGARSPAGRRRSALKPRGHASVPCKERRSYEGSD